MDRKTVKTHCEAINQIINKYCSENGLVFHAQSIVYDNTSFKYKCEVKDMGESGYTELSDLDLWSIRSNLPEAAPESVRTCPNYLGRQVYARDGRIFKLTGFNRKKKYC